MSLTTSKNLLCLGVLGLSVLSPTMSYANNSKLSSIGGLTFGTQGEDPYWFAIGGQLKFDAVAFEGNNFSKGTQFRSGLNLRAGDLNLDGGIGEDISYTISIESDSDRKFNIEDAWVTYHGWWENFTISAGQVCTAFSLESASSGKWIPFMERSMPTIAFGPNVHGLGIMANKWGKHYSINASVTTPQKGYDTDTNRSDRLGTSGRLTIAPWRDDCNIFQVGLSGNYERVSSKRYQITPELRARNTVAVLDTGVATRLNAMNDVKSINTYGIELSFQHGPFYTQAEYQKEFVRRTAMDNNLVVASRQPLDKLKFHGYHVLAAYVLTGETRKFSERNGTFNQVIPDSDCGAWEIAARYSFINLRDKTIASTGVSGDGGVDGGTANSITFGINYYLNKNVKIAANYIRSVQVQPDAIHSADYTAATNQAIPGDYADYEIRRKLNIFGARIQVVF